MPQLLLSYLPGNTCIADSVVRVYRGLLPPKVVVEDIGGARTDAGMLGYGIYFADLARFVFICFDCMITAI